ncbi:MAG: hypothetical protein U9Q39_07520, partial [Pseudomonadota bacterium]|nr:hypothetical protein [Pseudomonadota bacterium]
PGPMPDFRYFNLQFFYDFIESGKEDLSLKQKTHGITFELSDKFLDDDLNAGFRGTYFTSNEGSALEIFAEYKIGDNWTIAPGCMFFNGPKDSRLGQFNDSVPIHVELGSEVLSGSVIEEGRIVFAASHVGTETTMARISTFLENSLR